MIRHTREAVVERESSRNDDAASELSARAPGRAGSSSEHELRDHVPAELRNVDFSLAVRGYDRAAVDTYVKRVNHLIAELEVSRSPRSAVQHALDRASEEVSAILQRAQEAAEEITGSARKEADESAARTSAQAAKVLVDANDRAEHARAEADEVLAKAKSEAEKTLATARAEAEAILVQARTEGGERLQRSEKEIAVRRELAEARMRDLQTNTDIVWEERRELLDDISGMAARLTELAGAATARFPSRTDGEQSDEESEGKSLEPEANDASETSAARHRLAEVGLREEGGEVSEEKAT